MYGINLNPILPVRTNPQEQAEQSTQLLFGELFSILEESEKWLFICNKADEYKGWINRKMATIISEKDFLAFDGNKVLHIFKPIAECLIKNKQESIFLPAGSLIHSYDFDLGISDIIGNLYKISPEFLIKNGSRPASGNLVVSIAKSFLNAPYLWGGKSIFGIDCSGLVQVVFNICNIQLPRDASLQIEKGGIVENLKNAQAGDIAFFENEKGQIIHVGILLDNSEIIHASGKVKIEKIDDNGIISQDNGKYTHNLKMIKRIIL
jgi:hypothetical protein